MHLTGSDRTLFGMQPSDRLSVAIDVIGREHADAEFCLFTGDLADNGSLAAYHQLARLTATLPMPSHFLVGNHDSRSNLLETLVATPRQHDGFAQYRIDTEHGCFLLLDTARLGEADGELCESRREWLRRQLVQSKLSQQFFLVMHHPPLALGIPSMDQYALTGSDLLWEVVGPFRDRIRHIFAGHIHRAVSGSWRGIPFSCAKSTNHQVALDLHTKSVDVPGCHDAPGFAVILIDASNVVVHHQEFLSNGPAFWI